LLFISRDQFDQNKFYCIGVNEMKPKIRPRPVILPANHNGGPPIEDPPDHIPEWGEGEAAEYFQWKAALRRARKNVPYDIMMFRLSRAEAAGVDYETYVTELLERGNRLQAGDDREKLKERWKQRPKVTVKPI
jgi:hypothetical protein